MGEDTAVNSELFHRGYVAYRAPDAPMIHHSPCRTPWRLVRHHFLRGRGWGQLLLDGYRQEGHLLNRTVVDEYLVHHLSTRLRGIGHSVGQALPSYRRQYSRAFPLVVVGAAAAWLGMWAEILRPRPGKVMLLLGRSVRTILVLGVVGDQAQNVLVVRCDLVAGQVRGVELPRDLSVVGPGGHIEQLDDALGFGPRRGGTGRELGMFLVRDVVGRICRIEIDDYLVTTWVPQRSYSGGDPAGGKLITAPDLLALLRSPWHRNATSLSGLDAFLVRGRLRQLAVSAITVVALMPDPADGGVAPGLNGQAKLSDFVKAHLRVSPADGWPRDEAKTQERAWWA